MRLIDADILKSAIIAMDYLSETNLNFICKAIDNAPTVDLKDIYQEGHYDGHLEGYTKAINEERLQGEWITWEEAGNYIASPNRHECSCCHDSAQVLVNGIELLSDFCPNCGAYMKIKNISSSMRRSLQNLIRNYYKR